jgi:hypothetical protein
MEHFEEVIKRTKLNYNNTVKKLEIELNTVGFLSSPYDVIRENFNDWDIVKSKIKMDFAL